MQQAEYEYQTIHTKTYAISTLPSLSLLTLTHFICPHLSLSLAPASSPPLQAFDGRWKKFGQPKFVYTVDVQMTLDQCRAIRIKPAEGRIEALSDIESLTEHLDTLKGYSSIADGLYGALKILYLYRLLSATIALLVINMVS
jgi:hypothetical protein